jgi:hypothetical protein
MTAQSGGTSTPPWQGWAKGSLFGLAVLAIFGGVPFLWWRRRQIELRRMRAMDAG